MGVPNIFANATTQIPLVQLDQNFATNATIGASTVGLGNTTPSLQGLSSLGVGMTAVNIVDVTQNKNGQSVIGLVNSNVGGVAQASVVMSNGTKTSTFGCLGTGYTTSGVFTANTGYIGSDSGCNFAITSGSAFLVAVNGSASQSFAVDASGNVLAGINSPPSSGFHTFATATGSHPALTAYNSAGNGSAAFGIRSLLPNAATSDTSGLHLACVNGSSNVLLINSNGNVTNQNNSYGAISDARLKSDLGPMRSVIDAFAALPFHEFFYIHDVLQRRQFGIFAQDARALFPWIIDETPASADESERTGPTKLEANYMGLAIITARALQEAIARIATLEEKIKLLGG